MASRSNSPPKQQLDRRRLFSIVALASVLFIVVGFVIGSNKSVGKFDYLYEKFTISDCIVQLEKYSVSEELSLNTIQNYIDICYNQIHSQGLLNEFQVRRAVFEQQNVADNVLMWMVVLLTFSGVILAGLQLASSYKLATVRDDYEPVKEQEFIVERGKVVVRSSVTGFLILIASFAFFYIYIVHVYTIKEESNLPGRNDETPPQAATPTPVGQGPQLSDGGIPPVAP